MNGPTELRSTSDNPSTRRIARRCALALGAAVVVVFAYRGIVFLLGVQPWGSPPPPPAPELNPAPSLVVRPADLDLGQVHETSAYQHRFRLTNVTDRPVTVHRFTWTCDCLDIEPAAAVEIAPGATTTFLARLKLVSRQCRGSVQEGEPFAVEVTAHHAAPGAPQGTTRWTFQGRLLPTICCTPPNVALGAVPHRLGRIEKTIGIEASDYIDRIECEPHPHWTVTMIPLREGKFEARLRSATTPEPRRVEDVIRLTPVGREGQRLPPRELGITGDIITDVQATPAAVQLGRLATSTTRREMVQFHSLTGRNFSVQAVTSTTGALQVTREGTTPGAWVYSLSVRAERPGSQVEEARFRIGDGDGDDYTVVVPVRYHGTQAPESEGRK